MNLLADEQFQLILNFVGLFALSAALCATIIAVLLKSGLALRLAPDHPNERSLHSAVVPRCGGWGVIGTVLVFIASAWPLFAHITIGVAVLAAVSFIDDRRGLPAWLRLIPQFLVVLLVLRDQHGNTPWAVYGLIALFWIWMINLYNFMDGSNGLAGVTTVVGFISYAVLLRGGSPLLSLTSLSLAGAAAGFLIFNWTPARVFLGDAGSIPIGFLAGAVGFLGYRDAQWPLWTPVLVFSPFIADATVTLVRRALRLERVWHAHREHYYQRLIQSGFTHAQTALLYGAAMAAAGIIATLIVHARPSILIPVLTAWCALLLAAGVWIDGRSAAALPDKEQS